MNPKWQLVLADVSCGPSMLTRQLAVYMGHAGAAAVRELHRANPLGADAQPGWARGEPHVAHGRRGGAQPDAQHAPPPRYNSLLLTQCSCLLCQRRIVVCAALSK